MKTAVFSFMLLIIVILLVALAKPKDRYITNPSYTIKCLRTGEIVGYWYHSEGYKVGDTLTMSESKNGGPIEKWVILRKFKPSF